MRHLTSFSGDIEAISVTDEDLPPGSYVFNIEAIDVLGQSATFDVQFTVTGIVRCVIAVLYYHSVPVKHPWALKHNSQFWPTWALTRDINSIFLYRSCYIEPLKCGTWALTWEWVLARDTTVLVVL